MQVQIVADAKLDKLDHLFVLIAEGETESALPEAGADAIAAARFQGRSDESLTVLGDGPRKITMLGLGKAESITLRGIRGAITSCGRLARKQRDAKIAVLLPHVIRGTDADRTALLAADILAQSDYKYDAFITVRKDPKPPAIQASLVIPGIEPKRARELTSTARAIAEAVTTVRDLGNAPANVITPSRLADRAKEVASAVGVKCTVFKQAQIERMKMGGLLAVNRGSVEEPRFVVMEYAPRGAKKHVALVGKGITFDSGGISIKPAEKMEEMKFDMCGAAAVIGTVEAAARLKLPVRVTGIFAATDNVPSGSAYKPGEIITMMNGKTVEVVNTDAEGRMILADALHYASTLEPDHLIDYATLTGACVVALGSEAAGLFSPDDDLAQKLIESGERTGDRVWRMPVWDDYRDLIRSEWADMKNSGGRWGGAITAAVFLKEFVTCPSWAHLDIAGTAYAESENAREARGASGAGVRLTVDLLANLAGRRL